jgi:hypothetical protein
MLYKADIKVDYGFVDDEEEWGRVGGTSNI